MKKIFTVLLMLAISLSFTGCQYKGSVNEINIKSINYNNYPNFRSSCDLWVNNDVYLYNSDGFYNMRTFCYQNGNRVKLLESNDFINETYGGRILPMNDFAYFSTTSGDNNQNFYKFSFPNQSYEKITTIKGYLDWIATPEYIVYIQFLNEESSLPDLFVYIIDKDTTFTICNDVLSFGIVDNKIRYLTSLNAHTLASFEYDHTSNISNKIGEIQVAIDNQYPICNFTSNYTIIAKADSYDWSKITVHSFDGLSHEYRLPKPIQQFVAGENFAYAVCYETEEYSTTSVRHKDNGIYKINLANGSYEVIETLADEDTEIHVVSDDEIYITQHKMNFIGQYKGHVHKMMVSNKTKTKVFVK